MLETGAMAPDFTLTADAWHNRREALVEGGQQLVGAIERQMTIAQAGEDEVCRPETDAQALHIVTHTLDAMARGGMYDQLGGGFHRYSCR